MTWETVIGLEVHVQLATKSKIFSGASTQYGAKPNSQASAIDLGLPGVLPVLNKEAVHLAVRFGLSIDAEISEHSVFARKNYFYPDLPKGYQISQYELPIVKNGHLDIEVEQNKKRIGIARAHLEEDAGKSVHENFVGSSGIDLNRAGTPLLEIVSHPDMRSAKEAITYLKLLHTLVRYLGISDGNMQEGSFRCDVNISVRPLGETELGTRTELKNLNSFRFIERAIQYEQERQIEIIENGGTIRQETRLYDPERDETRPMRSKEEAHDYRYFPDPDLLPIAIEKHFIAEIKQSLPELPWEKAQRFQTELGLKASDATQIAFDLDTATYFEKVLQADPSLPPKQIANWIISDLTAHLNKEDITFAECPVTPDKLAKLILRVKDNTISLAIAKKILETVWAEKRDPDLIIEEQGLKQISDTSALEKIIDKIIQDNPQQTNDFRAGKEKLMAFFVGQVMKATQGKANPTEVNRLLQEKLRG